MDIPLIAARAVHFAGSISLAGLLGFVAFIAPRPSPKLRRRLRALGWISFIVAALSGPLRLLFVGQSMTGDSLAETISQGAARLVLISTQFGHVALLRGAIAILLVPCVAMLGRRRVVDLLGTLLAVIGMAAMAWQGHAGADVGWDAIVHLSADAAHLIAASLWLGALLPLALLLREPGNDYLAARRFSTVGLACVAVLLVSGVVNAWYLVGSVPALFGTSYGQTLLAKLVLVGAILCLAAINRWRLVPRLAADSGAGAAHRLSRHAAIEAAFGLGVIVIVAALGTMIPAAHEPLRWPFPYRLSLAPLAAPSLRVQIIATTAVALLGLVVLVAGIWQRRLWAVLIGAALLFGVGWRPVELLAVAATPTSYAQSPEPFAVPSIFAGDQLYRQQCVSCHGEDGEGDGPLAAELPIALLDLTAPQIAAQPVGDLFWALTVGMDGGVMPSFAALAPAQRWNLLIYLEAQRQSRAASSTLIALANVAPSPLAPDFTLPHPQGNAATLGDLRAEGGVLLVFATLPQSQPRLDQLAQWQDALRQADVTVVTITDSSNIRAVYALYEQRPQVEIEAPAAYVEFLIDRNGYLRARWQPGDTPDWGQLPALEREIAAMTHFETSAAPVAAPTGHVHEE